MKTDVIAANRSHWIPLLVVMTLLTFVPVRGVACSVHGDDERTRFVLRQTEREDGLGIEVQSIEPELKGDDLSDYTFRWGVKYPGAGIRWLSEEKAEIVVKPDDSGLPVLVFCQVRDQSGRQSALIHTIIDPQVLYSSAYNKWVIGSDGNFYTDAGVWPEDEGDKMVPYDIAQVYVDQVPDLLGKYYHRSGVTDAVVHSPRGDEWTVRIRNSAALVRDILPSSEIDWIRTHSQDSDIHVYILKLGYLGKEVQLMPVLYIYEEL